LRPRAEPTATKNINAIPACVKTIVLLVAWSLNMSVAGVVAHQSALKDGELLKVPQYTWPPKKAKA